MQREKKRGDFKIKKFAPNIQPRIAIWEHQRESFCPVRTRDRKRGLKMKRNSPSNSTIGCQILVHVFLSVAQFRTLCCVCTEEVFWPVTNVGLSSTSGLLDDLLYNPECASSAKSIRPSSSLQAHQQFLSLESSFRACQLSPGYFNGVWSNVQLKKPKSCCSQCARDSTIQFESWEQWCFGINLAVRFFCSGTWC